MLKYHCLTHTRIKGVFWTLLNSQLVHSVTFRINFPTKMIQRSYLLWQYFHYPFANTMINVDTTTMSSMKSMWYTVLLCQTTCRVDRAGSSLHGFDQTLGSHQNFQHRDQPLGHHPCLCDAPDPSDQLAVCSKYINRLTT